MPDTGSGLMFGNICELFGIFADIFELFHIFVFGGADIHDSAVGAVRNIVIYFGTAVRAIHIDLRIWLLNISSEAVIRTDQIDIRARTDCRRSEIRTFYSIALKCEGRLQMRK